MANVSFTNPLDPTSAVDAMEVQRRMALAQMLQQQAMSPLEAQQGLKVMPKISPFQGIAKILQGYMAGKVNADAMDYSRESNMRQMNNLVAALGGGQGGASPMGPQPEQLSGPGMGEAPPQASPMNQPQTGNTINPKGWNPQLAAMLMQKDPGKFAELALAQPEIVSQIRAAGVDPNSQQGRSMVQAVVDKAGFQAPENVREGSTLVDPKTRQPFFNAPKDGRQITYQGGQPQVNLVPGGMEAIAAEAAAKQSGLNTQTATSVPGPTGAPQVMTKAQEVAMANGGAPQGVNPASWAYAQAGIPHEIQVMPDGSQKITVTGGPGTAPKGASSAMPSNGLPGKQVGQTTIAANEQKDLGGNLATQAKEIDDKANSAQVVKQRITDMRGLSQNFTTGMSTPLKEKLGSFMIALGNDEKKVNQTLGNIGDMQAFNKESLNMAFDMTKQLTSRPAAMEVMLALKANPNLAIQPDASKKIMDVMEGIADYQLAKQQGKEQYFGSKGTLQGFEANWNSSNPISKYVDFNRLNSATPQGATPSQKSMQVDYKAKYGLQ